MGSTIELITELVFLEELPTEPNLLFVFGNEWLNTMDEVKRAYEQHGPLPIIITGNSAKGGSELSEASRFFRRGVEIGIPEDAMTLEHYATNTKENIKLCMPLIEEIIGWNTIKEVAFVCKNFHTRRVQMTARNHFPKHLSYTFIGMPDSRGIYRDSWHESSEARARVLAELRRIGEYSEKGDLTIF
jgi:uncharacterized SAM-binding protein YcdF (DUF218 family)